MNPTRRHFLTTIAATTAVAGGFNSLVSAAPKPHPATSTAPSFDESPYDWHDLLTLGLEGQAFTDTESPYDRLPARAKSVVRTPVWNLSKDTAGFSADFTTDTPSIAIRYELTSPNLALANMPAIGVSGIDLYAQHDSKWRWLANTHPATQRVAVSMVSDLARVNRRYRLYLPLYNGIKSAQLGLPKNTPLTTHSPRRTGSIVYYGTSIAQGGCASRPGMAFTSILSRRLDRPFVNLAFSGNGTMDPSVGQFLIELDPAVFVIDCLPNMNAKQVAERTEPLVRQLRAARPTTPILLVEDRSHGSNWAVPASQKSGEDRRHELKSAFDRLNSAGIPNLHYLPGDNLLGDDNEALVDGSHPSDLGMVRYADALEPILKKILMTP